LRVYYYVKYSHKDSSLAGGKRSLVVVFELKQN